MDRFEDLIRRIVKDFNAAGVDYMLTEAFAASYYGTPRTTMDIDIVVKVAPENLQTHLVAPIRKADMQVNDRKINDALRSGFRIISLKDKRTPFTLDVVLSDKEREETWNNSRLTDFLSNPEGLILSKLRMIKGPFQRRVLLRIRMI